MNGFVGGLKLSGLFYEEAVRPILNAEFPGLTHSAALMGYGSEVLGYDTPRSTDHEWGPRILLFLSEEDFRAHEDQITETLRRRLPHEFGGYPTHFGEPDEEGVRLPERRTSGPVDHKVEIHTVRGFLVSWTGLDPNEELEPADWLCTPQQKLLEVTAGHVYHDGLGELGKIRAKLGYYPRDVWLYLLAAQWRRIGQQEAFVGRTGDVGDDLGSGLIAASLVRDLMRLCFLMEKRYAPYSKWFGTAFAALECAPELGPLFERVLASDSWREREKYLSEVYETVGKMHDSLDVTAPLGAQVSPFHGRPYLVIHAERFVAAIDEVIADPRVQAIGAKVGSVDQLSDSTDLLARHELYGKLRNLYE